MKLKFKISFAVYSLLWKLAKPWLSANKRLKTGFAERLVPLSYPYPNCLEDNCELKAPSSHELWIQAASGGEAYLAFEILKALKLKNINLKIFCSSYTEQGLKVLKKAKNELESPSFNITVNFFPFDEPKAVRRAVQQVFNNSPKKLLLLLETEIWPALLYEAKRAGVKSLVVNARMTEKSFKLYKSFKSLFSVAPDLVLAIDDQSLKRFSKVFGKSHTNYALMPNIKFERLAQNLQATSAQAQSIQKDEVKTQNKLLSFASIRKAEEALIQQLILKLLQQNPNLKIAVAPKHMERNEAWEHFFKAQKLNYAKRSVELSKLASPVGDSKNTAAKVSNTVDKLTSKVTGNLPDNLINYPNCLEDNASPTILLWDTFGELRLLYAHSETVFVGGSLLNLGGQNFLEPLEFGIIPYIGKFWSNFYWVGEDLFKSGLVKQVQDFAELKVTLIQKVQREMLWEMQARLHPNFKQPSQNAKQKLENIKHFKEYLQKHSGGTEKVAESILKYLN